MYSFERPVDSPDSGRSGDDVDGLLRRFMRAELPDPWPAFRPPARTTKLAQPTLPARSSRWVHLRSYLALAATVALVVIGSLCVSDLGTIRQQGSAGPVRIEDASASDAYNKVIIKEELRFEGNDTLLDITVTPPGSR